MNVIAGILIGVANPTMALRLGSSLAWGVVWVAYSWIRESPHLEEPPASPGRKRVPRRTLFVVEFVTASVTAGLVAVVTGMVMVLFS